MVFTTAGVEFCNGCFFYITTYDLWNFCTDGLPHGENQGIWIYHTNWPGQSSKYVSIWSVRNFAPINSWFFLCCPLELPPGPQDAGSSPPGWEVDPFGTNDADPMVIGPVIDDWLNPCYFWGVTPRGSRVMLLKGVRGLCQAAKPRSEVPSQRSSLKLKRKWNLWKRSRKRFAGWGLMWI